MHLNLQSQSIEEENMCWTADAGCQAVCTYVVPDAGYQAVCTCAVHVSIHQLDNTSHAIFQYFQQNDNSLGSNNQHDFYLSDMADNDTQIRRQNQYGWWRALTLDLKVPQEQKRVQIQRWEQYPLSTLDTLVVQHTYKTLNL